MIHMVTAENRHLYRDQIKEMHALRKAHFVDERGWSGMNVQDGGEYDDMDDERMVYFLALDDDGHIGVSMRSRPTEDKCVVADVFPMLINPNSPPVKAPGVWEISRIFATKRFRLREGIKRRNEVFLASVEAAVAAGGTRLVGIIDTFLLPQAMRFPWALKPLGLPQPYPEGEMIGVDIAISKQELYKIREALAIDGPIILPSPQPFSVSTRMDYSPQEIELLWLAGKLPPSTIAALNAVTADVAAYQSNATDEQLLEFMKSSSATHLRQAAKH